MLTFTLESTDGGARAGLLRTPHGDVPTPAFMAVGTQGTVKSLTPEELRDAGGRIVLSNTYHLYLRPGVEVIERQGGLHKFMAWDGPILTDSGGFQVFSLGHLRQLSDEGVRFRSHIDGSEHLLTPELAVEYQERLGPDIAMVLDHCPAYGESAEEIEAAVERTYRWAERSLKAHRRPDQALFGIVQGGWSAEVRQRSAEQLTKLGFPGYAIGGVSVGEPKALAYEAIEASVPHLPPDRPRYLMGVGAPDDLIQGIARGIDLFDCALPTRVGRNGALFTTKGRVNITNARFRETTGPVEDGCDCYTCTTFSAAYLHHLYHAEELLAYRLGTIHNLRFVLRLLEQARQAISEGTFSPFAATFLDAYRIPDQGTRMAQKDRWLAARNARGEAGDNKAER
jgi:queuine tRNA-ribosyltransferase